MLLPLVVVKVIVSQEECWVLLIDLGWDTWLPPSLLGWRKMKQQKIDQTTIKSTNRSQLNILLPVDHYLQVAASSHSLRKYFILTLLPLLQVERNFFSLKGADVTLLLGHWYEIMALYYVKSILTQISASRQDRRVLQKSKIIRIEFLSKWGMLQTSRYV